MKTIKRMLALLLLVGTCSWSFAQDSQLLDSLPTTKEEFVQSEKKVLATIAWLENTPLDQETKKHTRQYALMTAWLINSPNVSILVNANVLDFTKKNNDLNMFFLAGWTKYQLENNYSRDELQGNLAGLRCVIRIYRKGVGVRKDKVMETLVELEDKGELESWLKEQLANK
ncbi:MULTISPECIES: hypothetical protein [Niastella]|uniref:Uncharacterized protein n=1 Tax=Niastella soli TaxID=2821487 RepID=A0ABS3YW55_9BACT|nr:hypothetical protein [Niastella soli]MBO9202118.1 hypothetical protein [Niastella soli]